MSKKTVPITVRIPIDMEVELKVIGETIERNNPGAEANIATLTRYAINDFLKRHKAEKSGEELYFTLPIGKFSQQELELLYDALDKLQSSLTDEQEELLNFIWPLTTKLLEEMLKRKIKERGVNK